MKRPRPDSRRRSALAGRCLIGHSSLPSRVSCGLLDRTEKDLLYASSVPASRRFQARPCLGTQLAFEADAKPIGAPFGAVGGMSGTWFRVGRVTRAASRKSFQARGVDTEREAGVYP